MSDIIQPTQADHIALFSEFKAAPKNFIAMIDNGVPLVLLNAKNQSIMRISAISSKDNA